MTREIPRTGQSLIHTYGINDVTDFIWARFSAGTSQTGFSQIGPKGTKPTSTDRIGYTMSGVLITELLNKSAQGWTRDEIVVTLPIPQLARGRGIFLEQVVPFFTVNAMENPGGNPRAGYAVDAFRLRLKQENSQFGQNDITFTVNIALNGFDAFLHRIGFTVTFFGVEKPLPTPPVI